MTGNFLKFKIFLYLAFQTLGWLAERFVLPVLDLPLNYGCTFRTAVDDLNTNNIYPFCPFILA